ncbi:hypothetical protein ACH4Y0_37935 [Streptomyces sp. NPDC020707]|uniref:hypothetical protein n=1 Tax=Streptomyces sp. NPDC020707 TaxID=3365084 RepID=UPI003787AF46
MISLQPLPLRQGASWLRRSQEITLDGKTEPVDVQLDAWIKATEGLYGLLFLTKAVDHVTVGVFARWSDCGETSVAAVDRVG